MFRIPKNVNPDCITIVTARRPYCINQVLYNRLDFDGCCRILASEILNPMKKEHDNLARQMKEILKKKEEENRALLNLIRALHPDAEAMGKKLKIDN